MTGFSFPPPPPPPPKAASAYQPEQPVQNTDSGNRGRRGGRGDRGGFRGRGGQQQQQRGGWQQSNQPYIPQNFGHNGIVSNGGYGANSSSQQPYQSYPQQHYGQNGNANGMGYGGNQQQGYNAPANYQQSSAMPPAGAYVNPAFNTSQASFQNQSQGPQYSQSQQYRQQDRPTSSYQSSNYSPGQKRTREQAFGQTNRHPMKKPPSAPKVPAAPAVPSFGAPLPTPPKPSATIPAAQTGAKGPNAKKRVSLFGLSSEGDRADVKAEESEDEVVDEEAAYAGDLSSGPLQIEYNGETLSLGSPAELAEWLNERKRFFPTQRRIEEKKLEVQMRMDERRRIEQETRNARAAAAAANPSSALARSLPGQRERPGREKDRDRKPRKQKGSEPGQYQDQQLASPKPESTLDDARRELEMQMLKVQELQRRLAESEAKAAAGSKSVSTEDQSAAEVGPSDDVVDATVVTLQNSEEAVKSSETVEEKIVPTAASSEALQALEAALDMAPELAVGTTVPTAVSENDSSSSYNESSSSSESDDDAPEEATSKSNGPVRVAPPNSERPPCQVFARTGQCRYGPKCRFKHVASEQIRQARSETGKATRKTLFARLVEQEREEENRLVLQAIKYLGGAGFFSKK